MKKLLTIPFVFFGIQSAICQHHGGLTITPHWSMSRVYSGFWQNLDENFKNYDYSLGFSIGYQGLLMADKRFSFSYGINYSYESIETSYERPLGIGFASGETYTDIVREIETLHSMEIPATWRYNILKGKKFQPYVSVATTLKFPFQSGLDFTYSDGSKEKIENGYSYRWSTYFDLGVGINYKVEDYIFSVQPTIRPWNTYGWIGVGFSVMKKF